VRFYIGDCIESPIYKGGGLQSRCGGTPGSGGYEIVGSVTAKDFIAGTCRMYKETLWVRLNRSRSLRASPSRRSGVSQVMLPNIEFGLWIVLGLSNGPKVLLAGPEQLVFRCHMFNIFNIKF
jgi:hypothetical protein